MTESEIPEWFLIVVRTMDRQFPTAKLNEGNIEALWFHLKQYPSEVVVASTIELARRDKFISIAGLVEIADDLTAKTKGIPDPGDAWARVLELARRLGREQFPTNEQFGHLIVGRAVAGVGGWQFICDRGVTESTRARFFDLIKEYRRDALKEETRHEIPQGVAVKFLEDLHLRHQRKQLPEPDEFQRKETDGK